MRRAIDGADGAAAGASGVGGAKSSPGGGQVDPAALVDTPAELTLTGRARRTVDAFVADGGDTRAEGLAQAVATRTGCSLRTAQRVLTDHRQRSPASRGVADGADGADGGAGGAHGVAVGATPAVHTDNGHVDARADPAGVG
ncbi:MAG: hypothetical protein GEV12_23490 [Micromonosporaceae bacterium]|nr:hypothetical protein [Micromonosporaceae bacterium]